MNSVAAIVVCENSVTESLAVSQFLNSLKSSARIREIAMATSKEALGNADKNSQYAMLQVDRLWSKAAAVAMLRWFESTGAAQLLFCFSPQVDISEAGLNRLLSCQNDTGAAIIYSDFYDFQENGSHALHPLVAYQPGSLRDDFDFGSVVLLSGEVLREVAEFFERESVATEFGGWYDLRLRFTEKGPVVHLPEPTYTLHPTPTCDSEESHFSYVDPKNRSYQIEMEQVATDYLKRIGAYLPQPVAKTSHSEGDCLFPVEASVIIPVRNRERTIADAIESALAQETGFDFNVIVVDNFSTDGTTKILSNIAAKDKRLIHLTPTRSDLGIGGCWNEAIYSEHCGRYAVQLDSDDLYNGTNVLARIVTEFKKTGCAMVIGSYTIVDFDLNPIPPGLIDHREWTDENGQNNALRIAGLGAPRAFHVPTLRTIGFPNVSYGEDYAIALQMTRRFGIGRIYDSLYWCRRWEDNSDHALPLETVNRYLVYKDRLRTIEIAARKNAQ